MQPLSLCSRWRLLSLCSQVAVSNELLSLDVPHLCVGQNKPCKAAVIIYIHSWLGTVALSCKGDGAWPVEKIGHVNMVTNVYLQ